MQENQRIMLTKRLLKEGLLRLLKDKPLDKIGITELCRESGINRATFYRHYELPKDVLCDIRNDLVLEMRNTVGRPGRNTDIKEYLVRLFSCLYGYSDMLKMFIRNHSEQDVMDGFHSLYEDVLIAEGTLKQLYMHDPEDARLAYMYIAGGMWTLLRHWIMDDISKTPQEIAMIAYEVAQGNLLSPWTSGNR